LSDIQKEVVGGVVCAVVAIILAVVLAIWPPHTGAGQGHDHAISGTSRTDAP
jgi:hypothetical protein